MAENFSIALREELNIHKDALPANFNVARFVQNSVALLNNNETLSDFAKKHGTAQIKAGLMRAAFQNLDALNNEIYLIPYGSALTYMPSFRGMAKMVKMYSTRKVKDIFAKVVREGDLFEETIVNGQPSINFSPKPFNDGEVIGVFGVCLFDDGGMLYETMSKAEVENCRKSSKSKNSPAWASHWGEMAKKTVIRRLCKGITLDMDADSREFFNAGTEIETDATEIAKREIEENENKEELILDMDDTDEIPAFDE